MKKRLLSAALAFAMVLTLIPATVVPAFAAAAANATSSAPESGKSTVTYVYGTDYSKPVEGSDPISNAWAWEYKAADGKTYWASSNSLSGIIASAGNGQEASISNYPSGTYYDSAAKDDGTLWSTNFTLLDDLTNLDPGNATSLTINTFGHTVSFASGKLAKVTNLTIRDTFPGAKGSASGITRDVGSQGAGVSTSGLTLNAYDVAVGTVSLTGKTNNVNLYGGSSSGITLVGTTTAANGNVSYDKQTVNTYASRTTGGMCSLTGAIEVTGTSSAVTLSYTSAANMAITANATNGSVKVQDGTTVGNITVGCNGGGEKADDKPATVTVDNRCTAGKITYDKDSNQAATGDSTFTVNGKATGEISTSNGTVNLGTGADVGAVSVNSGTLNMTGTNGKATGAITLTGTTTWNFSGTGWTVGDVTADGNTLTIGNNWPTGRSNTFGTLDLGSYAGQKIKGGVFKTPANDEAPAKWFDANLQFMRVDGDLYYYYGKRELATAIAEAGTAAKTAGTLTVMGATPNTYIGFCNTEADNTASIALLGYGGLTGIYLPDKVNGSPVSNWTRAGQAKAYDVNTSYPFDTNSMAFGDPDSGKMLKLVLQSGSVAVSKLTNITAGANDGDVTATLTNNQIVLSGAVNVASWAGVKLTLTTDQVKADGTPVTFEVTVAYDTTTKEAAFSTIAVSEDKLPPQGVTVDKTTIKVGSNTYTLVTKLAMPAGNLKVAGINNDAGVPSGTSVDIKVTASMGTNAQKALATAMMGSDATAAEFDWTGSPAMRQAVNQALAGFTNDTTVGNWRTNAQRAVWNLSHRGVTPTKDQLADTGYDTVVLEPYMAVTVTAVNNDNSVMSASLVPSYRVIVVASDPDDMDDCKGKNGFTAEGYYIAQAGRALSIPLSDLTDNDGDNAPTFKFADGFTTGTQMHQDGTYVYTAVDGTYTITRAGKTGLGSVVFNAVAPLVTMVRDADAANKTNGKPGTYGYDNLQAAVDDTLPQAAGKEDKITVTAAYAAANGSGVINVTGTARKFKIETKGQTTITQASNNFTVDVDTTGHNYVVQLQKDVVVAGDVAINIAAVNLGTTTLSASKGRAGDVITVTLTPNQGNTATGVSAKTDTGAAITVTPSTTNANQYTFTVPAGAKSVTVTPSFKQGTVQATVNVSSSNQGTVTTTAAATNNKVNTGSTVGVTTYPGVGYRTMGVNIATNGSATSASRVNDNYFTFTVPSNATAVTVTPVYDKDNGTKFTDVWSTEYYSKSVAWAVSKGVTDGKSTYVFGSNDYCTRAQMVTFLWRAAGRPSVVGIPNPFVDVSPTLTPGDYYSAILWAVSKGITDGTDRTHFSPSKTVTRGEAVTFLYRYENRPSAGTNSGFYDVPASQWYARPVTWAAGKGITKGKTATSFEPNTACRRCEIVTFLYRDVTGDIT